MPKVTKTFSWTAGAEGFADRGLTADILAEHVAGDGDPAGCMRFTCAAPSMASTNEYWQTVGSTWEDWGVPAGATVTHIQIVSLKTRRPLVTGMTGAATLRVNVVTAAEANGVTGAVGLLQMSAPITQLLTWEALGFATISQPVISAIQASNSAVLMRLGLQFATAAGTVDVDYRFDELVVDIFYDTATTVKTFSWTADIDGFVEQGASADIAAAWDGTDGDPAGCIKFTAATIAATTIERLVGPEGGASWAAWGVPADATVLSVQLTAGKYRKPSDGAGNELLNVFIVNGTTGNGSNIPDGGTLLPFVAGAGVVAAWTAIATATTQRGLSTAFQDPATVVRLRLDAQHNGASAGAMDIRYDEFQITIHYNPATIPITPDFHNPPSDNFEPTLEAGAVPENHLVVELVQPTSDLGHHVVAGQQVEVRLWMVRTDTGELVPLDSAPVQPRFAVLRPSGAGTLEYLANDGSWHDVASDGPIFFHAPALVGGTEVWAKTLDTAGWSERDLILVAGAYRMGVAYQTDRGREVVAALNRHDRYAFDPTGLFK